MALLWMTLPIALMTSITLTPADATENTLTNNTTNTNAIPISSIGSNQLEGSTPSDSLINCCIPVLLAPIATSGNNVYVVWSSNDTGHFEILFRSSIDNGQSFTDKLNLSNSPSVDSVDPYIEASGSHVYISWWEDHGNGRREPFFIESSDFGRTFGPQFHLSASGPISSNNNSGSSSSSSGGSGSY